MNILIADDEEPCREMLRELFARETDISLTITCDGAQAWWALTEPHHRFDLGIFDLRMPFVDGLMLIARIRTNPALKHLPVMLCTGISDRDTIAKAARLAINHYIVKPYTPAMLLEKVRSFSPRYARSPERTLIG